MENYKVIKVIVRETVRRLKGWRLLTPFCVKDHLGIGSDYCNTMKGVTIPLRNAFEE